MREMEFRRMCQQLFLVLALKKEGSSGCVAGITSALRISHSANSCLFHQSHETRHQPSLCFAVRSAFARSALGDYFPLFFTFIISGVTPNT